MPEFYFVDTSALSKRYIIETGSVWVSRELHPAAKNEVAIVRTTTVELIAAISRRERGNSLTPSDATIARANFQADVFQQYQVVELTPQLALQAIALATRHGLRGYDAIQLSAALAVNSIRRSMNLTPIILLSSDSELNLAAIAEGLTVNDPNSHP